MSHPAHSADACDDFVSIVRKPSSLHSWPRVDCTERCSDANCVRSDINQDLDITNLDEMREVRTCRNGVPRNSPAGMMPSRQLSKSQRWWAAKTNNIVHYSNRTVSQLHRSVTPRRKLKPTCTTFHSRRRRPDQPDNHNRQLTALADWKTELLELSLRRFLWMSTRPEITTTSCQHMSRCRD